MLTVSPITADSRIYDATTDAAVHATEATLNGVIAPDQVSLEGTGNATGTFADKNVGTNKTVTVAGLSLAGADATNYSIQPTTTADITPRLLTANVTADAKVYDRTTSATVNAAHRPWRASWALTRSS